MIRENFLWLCKNAWIECLIVALGSHWNLSRPPWSQLEPKTKHWTKGGGFFPPHLSDQPTTKFKVMSLPKHFQVGSTHFLFGVAQQPIFRRSSQSKKKTFVFVWMHFSVGKLGANCTFCWPHLHMKGGRDSPGDRRQSEESLLAWEKKPFGSKLSGRKERKKEIEITPSKKTNYKDYSWLKKKSTLPFVTDIFFHPSF